MNYITIRSVKSVKRLYLSITVPAHLLHCSAICSQILIALIVDFIHENIVLHTLPMPSLILCNHKRTGSLFSLARSATLYHIDFSLGVLYWKS